MLVEFWNLNKALWSLVIFLTFGMVQPSAPIPVFESPRAAAEHLGRGFIYTGDKLFGALDLNVHPETLEGAIQLGPWAVKRLALDCDDVGCWAYAALRLIPGCTPHLYTLEDTSGRWGSHVICVYVWVRPDGSVERGAIDTNGWRELSAITSDVVLPEWNRIYASLGYRYTRIAHTIYPF